MNAIVLGDGGGILILNKLKLNGKCLKKYAEQMAF